MIQRGCSTAIEAAIAGVPALAPGWIQAPVDFETVDAVSVFCASEQEMIERIRSAVNGGLRPTAAIAENLRRVLEDWFFAVDGRAYQRVVEAILAGAGGRPATSPQRCRDALDGVLQPDGPWTTRGSMRVRAMARRALGLSIGWSFRQWREAVDLSWDGDQRFFDAAAVRNLVDAIQPVARKACGSGWAEVPVRASLERGDYHFQYKYGRSVTLGPSEN